MPSEHAVQDTKIAAVDVFCGAAGLSLGLHSAGISVVAGIDMDPDCQYPFEANIGAPFLRRDISDVTCEEVSRLFAENGNAVRLLAGCAPCQPFSAYTTKRRAEDDRWQLLLEFARLVEGVKPDVVTMENVPRLVHMELWHRFLGRLADAGYHVSWAILDASRYGVPQSRRRVVMLASRMRPIALPIPSDAPPPTVRQAIGKLPAIRAGDRSRSDPLHCARALTEPNLARIKASKPSGTWREWPKEMRVSCHVTGISRYPSVYGRMSWDKPAPTITTQFYGFGNGRFGHPKQDRALTLREGAMLQSFPRDFKLLKKNDPFSFIRLGKLIGNAVPPLLGKAIGQAIVDHVVRSR